jgi:hypothetical protein
MSEYEERSSMLKAYYRMSAKLQQDRTNGMAIVDLPEIRFKNRRKRMSEIQGSWDNYVDVWPDTTTDQFVSEVIDRVQSEMQRYLRSVWPTVDGSEVPVINQVNDEAYMVRLERLVKDFTKILSERVPAF